MKNPEISIVVPCHNEQDNLPVLVDAVEAVMAPLGRSYEIIITDDRSTDRSWEVLRDLAGANPQVRAQRFSSNMGESAASWAGIRASGGVIVVTMDADLQNDPKDLPALLDALQDSDCVCGTRVDSRSQGDHIIRIASSLIANWVRNRLSGEQISDAGCTYRAFRSECTENLKYFKGMHRFLPTLLKIEGYRVHEVPVSNNPRLHGSAHYGVWNRLFASFYDLLAVRWMKSRMVPYRINERVNLGVVEGAESAMGGRATRAREAV